MNFKGIKQLALATAIAASAFATAQAGQALEAGRLDQIQEVNVSASNLFSEFKSSVATSGLDAITQEASADVKLGKGWPTAPGMLQLKSTLDEAIDAAKTMNSDRTAHLEQQVATMEKVQKLLEGTNYSLSGSKLKRALEDVASVGEVTIDNVTYKLNQDIEISKEAQRAAVDDMWVIVENDEVAPLPEHDDVGIKDGQAYSTPRI